jgi:large subunit ribosomal protein L19
MAQKIEQITKSFLRNDIPDVKPGDTIKVHQKIREKDKEKIQVFEGLVLARRHGKGINSTITVRKVVSGFGVERIFPLHSPNISKIEVIKQGKVRRAKLYYLREAKGRKARLKKRPGRAIPEVPSTEAKSVETEE